MGTGRLRVQGYLQLHIKSKNNLSYTRPCILVYVSTAVMNTMVKSYSGRKGFILAYGLQFIVTGTERQEQEGRN